MIRKSAFVDTGIRYRPKFNSSEDYDLWTRLSGKTVFHNLNKVLVHKRVEGERKSLNEHKQQKKTTIKISQRELNKILSISINKDELIEMINIVEASNNEMDINRAMNNHYLVLKSFESTFNNGDPIKSVRKEFAKRLARGILYTNARSSDVVYLINLLQTSPHFPLSLIKHIRSPVQRYVSELVE
jgi:hypothetical protein